MGENPGGRLSNYMSNKSVISLAHSAEWRDIGVSPDHGFRAGIRQLEANRQALVLDLAVARQDVICTQPGANVGETRAVAANSAG